MSDHWNMRALGWSALGGSGDGMHVQLKDVRMVEDPLIDITGPFGGGLHIIELTAAAGAARPLGAA